MSSGPEWDSFSGSASDVGSEHVGHRTSSGIFSLDGQDFEVEKTVWIVGAAAASAGAGRAEIIVVDALHSAAAIAAAVGDRRIVAVVAHRHNDHIKAAVELREAVRAPVLLSGDSSFRGGPGATGRRWSSFPHTRSRSGTACSISLRRRGRRPVMGNRPAAAMRLSTPRSGPRLRTGA